MKKSSFAILLFLLLGLFSISIVGEKIPMNDGAGFDGEFYRTVAENFTSDILNKGYDNFRIQRIFPFFLINLAFGTLGIEATHQNLMHAMIGLHYANLLLLIFLFCQMARHLRWKESTCIVLFACFFLNHFFLKNCGYELYQTDAFALSIAMGSYLLYLKGFHKAAIGVGSLGIITWPLVAEQIFILTLFHKKAEGSVPAIPNLVKKAFAPATAGLYALVILGITGVFLITGNQHWLGILLHINPDITPSPVVTALSLVVFTGVLVIALRAIPWDIWVHPKEFIKKFPWKRFVLILGIALISRLLLKHLSNDELVSNPIIFSLQILFRPIKYPLIPLAGLVVYYGILPCLIILKFKEFCRAFSRQSLGHLILLLIILGFSLDSESRHMTSFMPILLLPLGKVLDQMNLEKRAVAILVALQLLLSHFFFPINTPELPEKLQNWDFNNWIAQRYFMNYGAFMDHHSYLIWLVLGILALICTRLAIKKH
ncbi:hypothetical protein [Fibrobacter sp. UWEL]|uniref:hypothetical protein n=1 Tax=Fibrobacter sp. UWEL TaxID=1896209 RepID=UPI00091BE654|nr:hypothetical protein [Fibrobacter sp. UWEL]SHK61201.1 hypothetical protein SAMN05720468_10448 [Fibrobacter sp. UWEL]